MNPQPWQDVDEIFQGALQRDPAERDGYVRHACHGDTELQREVSSPRLAGDMFDIIVPASALQNLPDYKLYVRTLLHGRPQEPYLVDGFPPVPERWKGGPCRPGHPDEPGSVWTGSAGGGEGPQSFSGSLKSSLLILEPKNRSKRVPISLRAPTWSAGSLF